MSNKGFVLRMGNMLLDGPPTIHEVESISNSYVEAATSLFWHCNSCVHFRSCRIYCDACGDEQSGFLNPLVRLAEWNRRNDLQNPDVSWPNVHVELIEMNLDCPELQRQTESLQQRLTNLKLVHFGLPVRRGVGNTNFDKSGRLRIETIAGSQTISRSFWISEAPMFGNDFDSIVGLVRRIGKPANMHRWVEHYGKTPDQISANAWWHWNYKRSDSD